MTDLTFLHWPDGRVETTMALRREIARVIRSHRPHLVITQSPERNYERIFSSHPDHMATGEATLRAVYPDARNPHAFPELVREGFEPHTVRRSLARRRAAEHGGRHHQDVRPEVRGASTPRQPGRIAQRSKEDVAIVVESDGAAARA